MSRFRYFLIKCPNCGGQIDIKHDVVKRGEYPIYQCRTCGANLQWDTSSILWVPLLDLVIAGVIYVISKTIFMGIFHLGNSGAEIVASIMALLAIVVLLPLAFRLRVNQ